MRALNRYVAHEAIYVLKHKLGPRMTFVGLSRVEGHGQAAVFGSGGGAAARAARSSRRSLAPSTR